MPAKDTRKKNELSRFICNIPHVQADPNLLQPKPNSFPNTLIPSLENLSPRWHSVLSLLSYIKCNSEIVLKHLLLYSPQMGHITAGNLWCCSPQMGHITDGSLLHRWMDGPKTLERRQVLLMMWSLLLRWSKVSTLLSVQQNMGTLGGKWGSWVISLMTHKEPDDIFF